MFSKCSTDASGVISRPNTAVKTPTVDGLGLIYDIHVTNGVHCEAHLCAPRIQTRLQDAVFRHEKSTKECQRTRLPKASSPMSPKRTACGTVLRSRPNMWPEYTVSPASASRASAGATPEALLKTRRCGKAGVDIIDIIDIDIIDNIDIIGRSGRHE